MVPTVVKMVPTVIDSDFQTDIEYQIIVIINIVLKTLLMVQTDSNCQLVSDSDIVPSISEYDSKYDNPNLIAISNESPCSVESLLKILQWKINLQRQVYRLCNLNYLTQIISN